MSMALEEPLGSDEQSWIVSVPANPPTGAEGVHEPVGVDEGRHDSLVAAADKHGAVGIGKRERLLGGQLERSRSGVVDDALEAGSRGLHGVRLVASDHHDGMKAAIAKAFIGATRVRSDARSEPTSGSL
jgi:hypothetical protein